jgi:hypothetical protein
VSSASKTYLCSRSVPSLPSISCLRGSHGRILCEVLNIHLTDLETRSDELVTLFQFAFCWVVQLGDAISGVASFPGERIVNVKKYLVTCADIELVEDVCSSVLSEGRGRPVGPAEKVAIGTVGFRVPVRTRNPTGESTNGSLRCGQNHRAGERGEGLNVAAVGEDRLEPCELLLKPRRQTSETEHSTRTSERDWEPLFDLTMYCSPTNQRA